MRSWLFLLSLLPAAAHAGGTVSGTVATPVPKHAAVWLEGVPAGSWTVPKEVPTIQQKHARFSPDFLVMAAGQSLSLPNDDRITHNVFSVSPTKKFDLGQYPQGETRTVQLDKPGIVELFCNIHENMHATVVVAPSTFFAVADASGHFAIAGVPAGTYKVVAFSPEAGRATTTVTVKDGAAAVVGLVLKR